MYLSQVLVNPRSRVAQREHRTPYETHRTVMQAFVETLPADERVLFRREEVFDPAGLRVLVQSQYEPDWTFLAKRDPAYLLREPSVKHYEPELHAGDLLVFRLVANPTVKRDGRRLGLLTEDEQWAWLERKAVAGGFACERLQVRISERGFMRGSTSNLHKVSHFQVQYDGLLSVIDPLLLLDTLSAGIGPAKGIGCGLLSIARPN